MVNKYKSILALLLAFVLCWGLVGCKFVVKETQVLMNPNDQVAIKDDDNSGADDKEAKDDTPSAEGDDSSGAEGDTPSAENGDVTNNNATTPGNTTTAATNKEPKLSGSLELQIWTNENEDVANAWTDVIDAFEEATGVKVTAYIGSQANTRMTKRWQGDNPPDMALLAGSGIPDVALEASGGLYDVTELLQTGYVYGTDEKIWDVIDTNYYPTATSSTRYYRVKIYCAADGIFWDQAYMSQLGLTAPTNYTELQNFVSAAKEKGIATFTTYGTAGHYALNSMVMPAIAAYGTDVYDKCAQGLASGWGSNEVREVFQRWYDFCRMDNALLKGTSSFDHTTSQMKWLNHDALLIGNGQWLPYEVENNTPAAFQMNFATSPLTLASQKPTVLMGAGSMIVAQKAKNIENAKAFARFLYTKESQETLASAQGYLTIRKDIDNSKMDTLDSQKRIISYIQSDKVQIVYNKYNWGSLNEEINAAVHGLMTGNMTVDKAVQHILNRAK